MGGCDNQDGVRPDEIAVELLADGVATGRRLLLNEGNGWRGIFDGLDEYSQGARIVYTVREEVVSGYTPQIAGDAAVGFTLTNIHKPETVTVAGEKTWNDENDRYGKRPESITIFLLANGTKVDEKTVTAENGWKWSFENKPKYEDGVEIAYAVAEETVAGYSASVAGYDVTNNLMLVETEIRGEKRVDVAAAPQTGFEPSSWTALDADAPMPGRAGPVERRAFRAPVRGTSASGASVLPIRASTATR